MNIALAVGCAYLLGAIPFAYIAARLVKGSDIRKLGGGNAGALNTWREIGPGAGLAVLLLDIGKGSLAVLIAQRLGAGETWIFVAGAAAVTGHNYSVFLKFTGGRGAATSVGVLLALAPGPMGIGIAIIAAMLVITRNMRFAVSMAFVAQPILIWIFGGPLSLIVYAIILPLYASLKLFFGLRRDLANRKGKGIIIDKEYSVFQQKRP